MEGVTLKTPSVQEAAPLTAYLSLRLEEISLESI